MAALVRGPSRSRTRVPIPSSRTRRAPPRFRAERARQAATDRARAHAERALELDPSLPDGHALLGIVAALYEYDWTESAREFGIAMGREPVPPWVRNVYSLFYLMYRGRAEDALLEMNKALSDDPLAVNLR